MYAKKNRLTLLCMYCAVELAFLLLKDTGQHNRMLQAGEACIFRNIQAAVQNQPNPAAMF